MAKNYYTSGGFNLICDVCGKKIKAAESAHRWDGFIVCRNTCYEERHPQDFVRARQDKISIPFNRPRPVDAFRYLQPLWDSVTMLDNDGVCDYLLTYSDYFISDYIEDCKSFIITVQFIRDFLDTVNVDSNPITVVGKVLTDAVTITDFVTATMVFIRDFSDTVNVNTDSAALQVEKPFVDTINNPTDSGIIYVQDYVNYFYFAEDYLGTSYTF